MGNPNGIRVNVKRMSSQMERVEGLAPASRCHQPSTAASCQRDHRRPLEAHNLPRCLDPVREVGEARCGFREHDNTAEIAESHGAKVV
jgi:hypothetical protein